MTVYADVLSGERVTEIDFAPLEADPPAVRHHDGGVVEGVRQIVEAAIHAGGTRVDVRRDFHGEGLMGPVLVDLLVRRAMGGDLHDVRLVLSEPGIDAHGVRL